MITIMAFKVRVNVGLWSVFFLNLITFKSSTLMTALQNLSQIAFREKFLKSYNLCMVKDKSNFGSMDQLAQSAQFYFLNSHFNQK